MRSAIILINKINPSFIRAQLLRAIHSLSATDQQLPLTVQLHRPTEILLLVCEVKHHHLSILPIRLGEHESLEKEETWPSCNLDRPWHIANAQPIHEWHSRNIPLTI
jgi:hypothetical protein